MNNATPRGLIAAPLLLLALLLTAPLVRGQATGSIAGTVVDSENGETLIGANVLIQGTTTGAVTDLDGRYELRGLAPGAHTLVFSYIGYTSKTVSGVNVQPGAPTTIDLTLSPDGVGLEEVTVEASADEVTNSEVGLLKLQARAPQISDGISAQQIRRSPDTNSGDALRRVTGVSIFGGRFLYVRGIPERYNAVLLNGAAVTSTEPDRRAFAFDMIPSNLLDNVVILKAPTPDLPGDFSGGLVRLTTVEFPQGLTASASVGATYNDRTSFRDFRTYRGGSLDFIGLDDGDRSLPAAFPGNVNEAGNRQAVNGLARTLRNEWAPTSSTAGPDRNFALSLGNSFGRDRRFGYIGSLTYRSSRNNATLIRRDFLDDGTARFDLAGDRSSFSTLAGGIVNLAFRPTRNHRFSLKNTFTTTGEDEVVQFFGTRESQSEERQTVLRFTSRGMGTSQLAGEHFFPTGRRGADVGWSLYGTRAFRDEPDYRRLSYQREIGSEGPFTAAIGPEATLGGGGRYFGELDETIVGGFANAAHPLGLVRLSAGVSAEDRRRTFASRLVGVIANAAGNGITDFNLYRLSPDSLFMPENFRQGGFSIGEYAVGTNAYDATQQTLAGYAMADVPFTVGGLQFRAVGGLRVERSEQHLETQSNDFSEDLAYDLNKTDLLPSINFTWIATPRVNLRLAASQTLNRPELRELAPYGYYDYNTQTTFFGNPDLRRAVVQNFDVRAERYSASGGLVSASFFYKKLTDAIEQVVLAGVALGAERTYQNADEANNYGIELEARQTLAFLGGYAENFSAQANYTYIQSEVTVKGSDDTEARTGRRLQGQAPYTLNLGLSYTAPGTRTNANVLYNRIGSRIFEVSSVTESDVTEEPRDVIDFTVTQPFGRTYELRLTVRDLLQQDQKYLQGAQLARLDQRSRTVGLSATYRF